MKTLPKRLRAQLHEIIFEADTPAGKLFDIVLLVSIVLSVVVVMADSVKPWHEQYTTLFFSLEWIFTILFTLEYLLRIYVTRSSWQYMKSFYGIIDLLAILPTYLRLILPGSQYFMVVRVLRVLRIFRVLKFVQYLKEAKQLMAALRASHRKITVFLFTVFTLVIILGSIMYMIEGEKNGFTSIPKSIYWAIVTLTTVGYGDIAPQTNLGQTLAALIMVLGYAIIAVPTGIVTAEMTQMRGRVSTQACPNCSAEGHEWNAVYCKFCGEKL